MEQDQILSQEFNFASLFKFTAPSIFVFVFISVYQMVDGLFIENYVGEMAISAINLYFPIISLFIAVGLMLGTGGNAVIVKKVGEGRTKEAGQTFSRVITFTLIVGIVLTAVTLIFADPIMRLCGATDGNIEYLRPYYLTMSSFSLAILFQSELGILVIGEGKTEVAAVVIMIGGVLNCVLDYVFMGKLGMGIEGAAIATVIGYCSTIVYAVWFYIIARKSSYHLEWAKPDLKETGFICFNGSSDMVSSLAEGVTILFLNHQVFRFYGLEGVSALTVVTFVQVLIGMVFMGYVSAVEPVLSYHYGSGNTEMRKKIYRLSIIWSLLIGVFLIAVLFLFRNQIIGIFFPRDSRFFEIAKEGYLISLPACLFIGINVFGSGLFTAFSNGLVSQMLSLVRTFIVLTACIYLMPVLFGGIGVWIAWPIAEAFSFIVTIVVLNRYRRRYQYG